MAAVTATLRLLLLAVAVAIALARPAAAHESRPVFLGLVQQDETLWRVTWTRPMRGERVLGLTPRLPASCAAEGESVAIQDGLSSVEIWSVRCPADLDGAALSVDGLDGTLTDVLVRIEHANGQVQIDRLTPGAPSVDIAPNVGALAVAKTYTVLGIEHIAFGWDHLLFVALLVLISGTLRRILWSVTGFTVAHSITLALATFGVIDVPVPLVEALIALSIAVLAAEIAIGDQRSLAWKAPGIVASAFGLLHGLGFASALRETGIPQHEVPLSLLFFNVGVELGQLACVAALLLAFAAWRLVVRREAGERRAVPLVTRDMVYGVVYPIGILAGFWTVERTLSFV
jgi:hydrogenase/urease accessory protein HupE